MTPEQMQAELSKEIRKQRLAYTENPLLKALIDDYAERSNDPSMSKQAIIDRVIEAAAKHVISTTHYL